MTNFVTTSHTSAQISDSHWGFLLSLGELFEQAN